jgi:hypothetical protein
MKDEKTLNKLCIMIDQCTQYREIPRRKKVVNHVLHKKRKNRYLILSAQIGEYDMDNVILDLGSNANFLQRQTWEIMGKPNPVWSIVQLRLANYHNIILIERFVGVLVNIYGVFIVFEFEVINIMDKNHL